MTGPFTWSVVDLRLRHVFTIARGSRSVVPTVIVRFTRDGVAGIGEASPLARYGESVETVSAFLAGVNDAVGTRGTDPSEIPGLARALAPGNAAAKAGVDIAVHDWIGKRRNLPVWKMFGLTPGPLPRSSMTIGIDEPGVVGEKVREAASFAALKLKLGVPGEREFLESVRGMTAQPIRVDANEGWATKEEALDRLQWLEGQGVELVEQPLPAGNAGAVAWLRARTRIPLYADEDFRGGADLAPLADAYDGVNVKLMKCGGLAEALTIAREARSKGLKLMLGCMIETSAGISAAAQLAPQADVVDLDGCLLVGNDPFSGAMGPDGTIRLRDLPGIGITEVRR